MITFLLCLLLGFFTTTPLADNTKTYSLTTLRQEYLAASKEEAAARRFFQKMADYDDRHPVKLAYKGGSEAVMAKYNWNPYAKLKHVKNAAALFEEAVAMDKTNPEIRFLRFTVEHYVPRYLNLSEHLQEDKRVIIEGLRTHPKSGVSTEVMRSIKDFMLTKDHCTPEEKEVLRSIAI
ncbi:hypothetical protein [Pontibacter cellulosilyticus]|uniref:Uncharacterized protein n=1 Tax=Pontibacter cellulosilyticus TaxID=1720253 RepID=A0A923SK59_9BACT|nr:hypothetical protein [Pontibacter cellulosilyticus]MBC5994599.1 hypothetical protein [Pontibacter cellulosilyticus]